VSREVEVQGGGGRVMCQGCRGNGYRWRETGRMTRGRHGSRARYPETEQYTCPTCNGEGTLLVQRADGPWRIRLAADDTVAGMQMLDFEPRADQRDVEVVPRVVAEQLADALELVGTAHKPGGENLPSVVIAREALAEFRARCPKPEPEEAER